MTRVLEIKVFVRSPLNLDQRVFSVRSALCFTFWWFPCHTSPSFKITLSIITYITVFMRTIKFLLKLFLYEIIFASCSEMPQYTTGWESAQELDFPDFPDQDSFSGSRSRARFSGSGYFFLDLESLYVVSSGAGLLLGRSRCCNKAEINYSCYRLLIYYGNFKQRFFRYDFRLF